MSKLTKVRMEFDDGSAQELTGDDAERWLQESNAALSTAASHGRPFREFPWKKFGEEDDI